jgi:YVTN family beta-propeller protein
MSAVPKATMMLLVGALAVTMSPVAAQAATPLSTVATISVGRSPIAIDVDRATDTIYAANSLSNSVSVINGKKNKVTHKIKVGHFPAGVAVDAKTNTIYVTNMKSNTVSVISGKKNKVVHTINVGRRPWGVGLVPATDNIYVANEGAPGSQGTVSLINGKTRKVTRVIPVGMNPYDVAVDPKTRDVYVGNIGVGTVSVIHGAGVVATITTGGSPSGLAVNDVTHTLYVADPADEPLSPSYVNVVNTTTNKLSPSIEVDGQLVEGVAVDATTNTVYVTNLYQGTTTGSLTVINGKKGTVTHTVSVGGDPFGVAVDVGTNRVYVVSTTAPGDVVVLAGEK